MDRQSVVKSRKWNDFNHVSLEAGGWGYIGYSSYFGWNAILVKVVGNMRKKVCEGGVEGGIFSVYFFGWINGWNPVDKVDVRQAVPIISRTQWSAPSPVTGHRGSIWGRFLISSSASHSWAELRNVSDLGDPPSRRGSRQGWVSARTFPRFLFATNNAHFSWFDSFFSFFFVRNWNTSPGATSCA